MDVKKKKLPDAEKKIEKLFSAVHEKVEELADGEFKELGITVETDFRGYTTSMTIRVHKDKFGGLLKTHTYKRVGARR